MAFEDRAVRDHLPEFGFQKRRIWQQADMEEVSLMNEYKGSSGVIVDENHPQPRQLCGSSGFQSPIG